MPQQHTSYELVPEWGAGESGFEFGIVSGQATDSSDRVYVIDREPNPGIAVLDSDGRFLRKWGQDIFHRPHDIWIDEHDKLFITDVTDHTVRICTTEGEVLRTIGTEGQRGATGTPFSGPTRAVTASDGEVYVSDGYGQHYVHRMTAKGELIRTWGGEGSGPGQFSLPHNIVVTEDRVIVADREPNHRVCLFDRDGEFQGEWTDHQGVCGLFVTDDGTVVLTNSRGVCFIDPAGKEILNIPIDFPPADQRHGAHSVWIDQQGSLYVGEVGAPNLLHKYRGA